MTSQSISANTTDAFRSMENRQDKIEKRQKELHLEMESIAVQIDAKGVQSLLETVEAQQAVILELEERLEKLENCACSQK